MNKWFEPFLYDESVESCLRWKVRPSNRISIGDMAGASNYKGYYQVSCDNILVYAHRIVWEMHRGDIPDGMQVDHIDQNKKNNRISNLRLATNRINQQNMPIRIDNSSGITGVARYSSRGTPYWKATWSDEGKRKSKSFSIAVYGEEGAKDEALSARKTAIKNLNEKGNHYTEIHGL